VIWIDSSVEPKASYFQNQPLNLKGVMEHNSRAKSTILAWWHMTAMKAYFAMLLGPEDKVK
jgi:hypothetical protein